MATVPGSTDLTRFMTQSFDERGMVPVPVPYSPFWSSPSSVTQFVTDAETIEIDIIRGVDTIVADLVNRGTSSLNASGKEIVSGKYTNIPRKFPLVETLSAINSTQLLKRVAGETPFAQTTREDRFAELARDQHETHIRKHVMTKEILRRQAILTGKHDAIFGQNTTELEYDFHRSAANTIPAPIGWNQATGVPIVIIDAGIDVMQQGAYLTEDMGGYGAWMGTDAFTAFKENTTLSGPADNRRYRFIELGGPITLPPAFERFRNAGLNPRGVLETDKGRKVWIFTYDQTFIDTFSVEGVSTRTPWMPLDQTLLFHPSTRCDSYFGPPDRLPFTAEEIAKYQEVYGFSMISPPMPSKVASNSATDPRMFYCDAIWPVDMKSVQARTQSSGIYATTQTDGFVMLTGLVT